MMTIHNDTQQAESRGELVRPKICETCDEEKELIKHHRNYDKPLEITWLCRSCHGKEHANNKKLTGPFQGKLIKIDSRTHEIIRREAIRQSMKPNTAITMKDIIRQYADKLNRKHKYISRGE